MALSNHILPKLVSLAGDPVIVGALSTSHLITGSKTIYCKYIGGTTTQFSVEIGSVHTFNIVEEISSNTDILSGNHFADYNKWLDHIAERLSLYYPISSLFSVVHSWYYDADNDHHNGIVFTSHKNEAIAINITTQPTNSTSSDKYTAGTSSLKTEGYLIGLRIYDELNNLVDRLEETPDESGEVKFNISSVLESIPEPDFNFEEGVFWYSESCKAYKYDLYEKVGILNPTETDTITSDVFYAIAGKSSYMQLANYNEESSSFYDKVIINKPFLSLQPKNKYISPSAPELLYFLVMSSTIATIKLHASIHYTDGSMTENTISNISAKFGKLLQINISPALIGLFGFNSEKQVFKYSIVLRDESDIDISEERTFFIDWETYDFLRYFIVQNSYGGGFDCIRATGEAESKGKVTKKFANQKLPTGYTTKHRYEVQTSVTKFDEYKLKWGLLSKNGGNSREWKHYIQQVEESGNVYEYINSIIVPCSFTTKSYKLEKDNETIHTHTSVYRRAYIDEAYSQDDIPVTGDHSEDYNDDWF